MLKFGDAKGWADQGVGILFFDKVAPDRGEEEVRCSRTCLTATLPPFRMLDTLGALLEAGELGVCDLDLVPRELASVVEELLEEEETGVCDRLLGVPFFSLGVGT